MTHSAKRAVGGTLVVALLVGGAVLALRKKKPDDAALTRGIIGSWRAVDLENPSLHKSKGGVASEEVTFKPDGTLTYQVRLKGPDGKKVVDAYEWKVVKGKLQLKYLGESSAGDVLPRVHIFVEPDRLTLRRRKNADKVFTRITESTAGALADRRAGPSGKVGE